ncbi:hypothetical protein AB0E01_42735 [Nocardia vinacea]|uniref:hypothetical protein n=1 Tax=Nocardia vinacea TaxID=96468 RepID=UPI0033E56DC5
MRVNTFSSLDVVVALDARNVEAHRTGTLEAFVEQHLTSPQSRCSRKPKTLKLDRAGPASTVTGLWLPGIAALWMRCH